MEKVTEIITLHTRLCADVPACPDADRFHLLVSKINVDDGKELLKACSVSEDPILMTLRGLCHKRGIGTPKDAVVAVDWFRRASALGNSTAMIHLGRCHATGTGVPKDPSEAIAWFRRSAQSGNTLAMNVLGRCYLDADIVTRDRAEAIKWFRKSIDLGSSIGMLNFGACLAEGDRKDPVAIEWIKKSVDLGCSHAIWFLAVHFPTSNDVEARELFRRGAERGNPLAMYGDIEYCLDPEPERAIQQFAEIYQLVISKDDPVFDGHIDVKISESELRKIFEEEEFEMRNVSYHDLKMKALRQWIPLEDENERLRAKVRALEERIENLMTEYAYRPGQIGYQEARDHFNDLISP